MIFSELQLYHLRDKNILELACQSKTIDVKIKRLCVCVPSGVYFKYIDDICNI